MHHRPTSTLGARLAAVILACLLLPTLTVGWLGYSEAYDSIRAEKINNVGRVASVRRDQLVTVLERTTARAAAFLSDIASRCADGAGGVHRSCADESLQTYARSERSLGVALRLSKAGEPLTAGTGFVRLADWRPFQHGQLARVSAKTPGTGRSYEVAAEDPARGLLLVVTFPVALIESLFANVPDLGQSGETFLADRDGFFVTPGRYPSVQGHSHPISARPMQACLAQQNREVLDQDYRDVAIIHGFRFVPEIGGGCIMAHIDQAEAFAPLRALQWRMAALTLLFIVGAGVAAVAVGRSVAGPVTRLTEATREIIGGNYQARAEVTGDGELAELARSFNRMAASIAIGETRVRAIIDGTLDAFLGVNLAGEVVAFNRGAEALFGLGAGAVLGRPVGETGLPGPMRRCLAEALARAAAGEPVARENFEVEGARADGRPLVAEAHLFTAGEGGGTLVIACLRDIAERRRAERKTQRLARILRTMSEGNQVLVRATGENELFREMCRVIVEFGGYRMAWIGLADSGEGKPVRPVAKAGHEEGYLAVIRISWADEPRGRGPTGTAIRSGVPQRSNEVASDPVVAPWREPALERGYLSIISLPLKDRGGCFGALTIYAGESHAFGEDEGKLLVELAEDVSYGIVALRTRREHEEMEHTLRQAQKMEAIGHLTGGIAHDFNNLLQVVLANLDLVLEKTRGDGALAGYLQNALAGAEQGARLTSQLLAFARRQPLKPEPLRLELLVGEMAGMLRRTLGADIAIETVAGGGLWTAMVDSNQLRNALLNLAINARDAMPGGGKLTIELNNSALDGTYAASHPEVAPGQYVMLAVTDTGHGMKAEVLERVFEPFFTTKAEGSGTGLGLAMVYGFVKQSGGHLKIYSEPGHGTTVKLYLPRTQQAEAARRQEEERAERGAGETVLVAEDDETVRASVVTQLAELGYRVQAAASGEAALAILSRGEPVDLLFTDVVMPGALNGRALAERARAIVPGLPVLYTSGYTENAIIHHGRLDEGVTLLSKPYRLSQLARAVRSVLGPSPAVATEPAAAPAPVGGLLVEDEEMVRTALTSLLEQRGFRVAAAASPSQALSLLEGGGVDILVTDFTLPEMNGTALIRQARLRQTALAAILASGHSVDTGDLPGRPVTMLLKPFHPQTLEDAIRRTLGREAG
ncbi:MAG: response regulator [Rhodospirillaceae bacterium]